MPFILLADGEASRRRLSDKNETHRNTEGDDGGDARGGVGTRRGTRLRKKKKYLCLVVRVPKSGSPEAPRKTDAPADSRSPFASSASTSYKHASPSINHSSKNPENIF